ncbi:MAG: zinc-dependent metalloprotease [Saprospiraceae bacterium]
MKYLFFLLFIICQTLSIAQVKPVDLVRAQKTGWTTISSELFTAQQADRYIDIPEGCKNPVLLTPDKKLFQKILNSEAKNIVLALPQHSRNTLTLQLVEVKVSERNVIKIEPGFKDFVVSEGKHFRGIIEGDEKSLVAISVFENEIMGFISSPTFESNLVLGKMETADTHILYEDEEMMEKMPFTCAVEEDGTKYTLEELKGNLSGERTVRCSRLYLEVDFDIYTGKGSSLTAVNNYITGIFNQVGALYANENLTTTVSQIVVWTQASPYNSTSSIGMLNAFTDYRQGFNGDLAQLLSYKASGGVAYVNGFCRSNPDQSMSFASIHSTYSNVPAYSWTVEVCAHEFGHLFGSQHTHACVWNGNNTAIDGCYSTEGGCASPGLPSGGGTVMSYCHLTSAGINFSNGFGLQPGNIMRSRVSTASCLGNCEVGGGGCTTNEVQLTIKVDNYPHETTWNLKNASNEIIYSGGPYSGANSIKLEDFCLPNGCYTFTIFDSYGDGICCSYGQGYYHIKKGETILGSGGQFSSTHVQTFCVSTTATPTCSDGIQNGQETGIDCGGPICVPCATCSDGIQNGQETGIDCGGPICVPCATCSDGIQNGQETGIDCGGPICIPCATCSDGIQNGQETGIDCGGPICVPCASCSDGIQNGQETGIDCGGPICVPCATCSDGIQNGQETGIDCGGPICVPCATCSDGIQNGQETGIDCGGPICVPCQGTVEETLLGGYYFETGWDGWTRGGAYAVRYSGAYASEGNYCIRISANQQESSSFSSPYYDLIDYDSVKVQFKFRTSSVELGESFSLLYYNGFTWLNLATYVNGVHFQNNSAYTINVKLSSGLANNVRFKFQCSASDSYDRVYIDAVQIRGYDTSGTGSGTCTDGVQNGQETGIDCGGPVCLPCVTCTDGIQNGQETGVDCGGPICQPCATCSDGVQNGQETGIDCGGPICLPCASCSDGIQNGQETGVDCGGPVCVPCASCFDGIQNGQETGVDCGGPTCVPCATCSDGIQNGQETGIDCGGPVCNVCNSGNGSHIGGYYFETGWDAWHDGGTNCFRYGGSFSPEGTYSIRMRNQGVESAVTSPSYNLLSFSAVSVEFKFKASGMESGKSFVLQYFNGSTYNTVATFVAGSEFVNNVTYNVTINLSGSFSNLSKFRFSNQGSDNSDYTFIDAVIITGFTGSNLLEGHRWIEIADDKQEEYYDESLIVYPNPVQDELSYSIGSVPATIKIFDTKGTKVLEQIVTETSGKFELNHLPSGMYIIIAETPYDVENLRFIKN